MARRFEVARAGIAAFAMLALFWAASASTGPVVAAPQPTKADGAAVDKPLDLNKATAEELESLPGVGPSLARRIVEFREKEGPFKRVEDLLKVKGIGDKSFEKLRPFVRVGRAD